MTICDTTDARTAVGFAIRGGMFRLRLLDNDFREAEVLDDNGNVIGYAQTFTYDGNAWCVSTRPFAGHVPFEQVEIVR